MKRPQYLCATLSGVACMQVAFAQKQTRFVVSSGVDTTLKLWDLSPLETEDSETPVALKVCRSIDLAFQCLWDPWRFPTDSWTLP